MVSWRGLSAPYDRSERQIIQALTVREQFVVHTHKALTDGEVQEEKREPPAFSPPVYIDADDIPFGEPVKTKRKRPIYELAWTWRKHRIYKTKAQAQVKLRVWKKWYERQGWKVYKVGEGYFANGPNGERHAASIHEYDRDTKERVK